MRLRVGWLVVVRWVDATADCAWHDDADLGLAECESVGWIGKVDGECLVLVGARIRGEKTQGSRQAIPRAWVRGVERLR